MLLGKYKESVIRESRTDIRSKNRKLKKLLFFFLCFFLFFLEEIISLFLLAPAKRLAELN